jgi:tRNA (guanine37-N1)-methyltransferase
MRPRRWCWCRGRYEGLDERVLALVDEQVSLGDFVLTGGEYAALTIVDGLARLLPGVLGNQASAAADSYSDGLLEHAQYTRPVEFAGEVVPEVLRGGDHHAIAALRRRDSLARTRRARPDLLARRPLDAESRAILWDVGLDRAPRWWSWCTRRAHPRGCRSRPGHGRPRRTRWRGG